MPPPINPTYTYAYDDDALTETMSDDDGDEFVLCPDYPASPDFSFMNSNRELVSGYAVVHRNEAWNLLKNFNENSFMFCKDPKIVKLLEKVNHEYQGHSGASLACTMRILEFIAKNGYSVFKQIYLSKK